MSIENIIQIVLAGIAIIVAVISFIAAMITKHRIKKSFDNFVNNLKKNKEEQEDTEMQINKTLCDYCGIEVSAEKIKHITINDVQYDFCPSCADTVQKAVDAYNAAVTNEKTALDNLNRAIGQIKYTQERNK